MINPISPSRTADFLRCPTYAVLNRKWKAYAHWTPYFAMGHAIHRAIEVLLETPNSTAEWASNVAVEKLRSEYEEQDEWPLDALEALLKKGIAAMLKKDGGLRYILDREIIIGTEVKLGNPNAAPGDFDDATADLITERGSDFIITDHKNSLKLESKYIQRNLAESEIDWQMWDYAWRAQQKYGRIVTHTRRHLVIFSPTAKSILHESRLNQDVLQAWHIGALREWEYIWSMIEEPIENVPMRLTSCTTRYGRCPLYAACHTANRDPEKMSLLYKRVD